MPKIMLVDDEPSVLSSLRRTIYNMPANTFADQVIVETFDKPELALVRAAECDFDLVISDWRMPGMNGITFLSKLIQIQPTIARLVLSGYVEFLTEVKSVNSLRIFHFISKPWNNDELRTLMCQALEQRSQLVADTDTAVAAPLREGRIPELGLLRIGPDRPAANQTAPVFNFMDRVALRS
jgi:YesN/AraC family two-component response regulator